MAAFKQTMTVQAQVVENIAADQATLNGIVARSQGDFQLTRGLDRVVEEQLVKIA